MFGRARRVVKGRVFAPIGGVVLLTAMVAGYCLVGWGGVFGGFIVALGLIAVVVEMVLLFQKHEPLESALGAVLFLVLFMVGILLVHASWKERYENTGKRWHLGQGFHTEIEGPAPTAADCARIGDAVFNAARELGRAKPGYGGAPRDVTFSGKYWSCLSPSRGVFGVKDGVRPSAAIADVFRNPKDYRFGSADAVALVALGALLDLLGPSDFDRLNGNLSLSPLRSKMIERYLTTEGNEDASATPEFIAGLRRGDEVYVQHHAPAPEAVESGRSGMGAIFLGEGKYFAHPLGIVNEQKLVRYVSELGNPRMYRSALSILSSDDERQNRDSWNLLEMAELCGVRTRVDCAVLAEDRLPGEKGP